MASSDAATPVVAKRPFWMHQIAEYLLGMMLIVQGLQSPTPAIPALAGGLIVINVAIVRGGPLSAFNVVPRSMHRVLDLVVIAAVLVGAVQPWVSVESSARITMFGIALVMSFIWWQSSFVEKRSRRERNAAAAKGVSPADPSKPSTSTAGTSAGGTSTTSSSTVAEGRGAEIGRHAGRVAASGVLAARRVKNNRKT